MTKRALSRLALLGLLAAGLGSCSGGGIGLPPLSVLLFNFAPGFAGVNLNSPLELTFTTDVDPTTVSQDSIRIFTTTTTVEFPDPGAPAVGEFVVVGAVVRFLPRIPEEPDLSDAGLRIGFTYAIQVPSSPAVIEPVRTIEGDPNLVTFNEFFTTLNQTILPAPGDITAEPNLATLSQFFVDEGIQNGVDFCPRQASDALGNLLFDAFGNPIPGFNNGLKSPQVIDSDPDEGESGFGTITGIQVGLGTAFVRLDPISVFFSEPISPWRIREQNITIRNTNLGGETFDIFLFFEQDRSESRLQITVFDADSAFDQASVPQGRYVLELTEFTDLAGNRLVNPRLDSDSDGTPDCIQAKFRRTSALDPTDPASPDFGKSFFTPDGTFTLTFSTVSSPALPTDLRLTFEDDDGEGHVDVGGLATAVNDPNVFPEHMAPFLGGVSIDGVGVPSPSVVKTTANYGDIAIWTGCEVAFDNGFRPMDETFQTPDSVRLRGGSNRAATPIIAPIAGSANGPSDGSLVVGAVASAEPGKTSFSLSGAASVSTLFTGNLTTGPVVYHFDDFDLTGGATIVARDDSVFPLLVFVEDDAIIEGNIICDGEDGEFGFDGAQDGTPGVRTQGGRGGVGGPGGGDGGDGGARIVDGSGDPERHNGQTGQVPANVLGPLDQFSEAVAGLTGMVTGGGGHYDRTQAKQDTDGDGIADVRPNFNGGGGGGTRGGGTDGGDIDNATTPGETDQGVGGNRIGTLDFGFSEPGIFPTGGAGGGGGAADDDGGGNGTFANQIVDVRDDGGGGGGGGGGFFGLAVNGDCTLGAVDIGPDATPFTADDTFSFAIIRCVGGRGGSTYDLNDGNPPADITDPVGQGEAGGGGGGGGICIIVCGELFVNATDLLVHGKLGGNSPAIEAGGRNALDEAGSGGAGKIVLSDGDGVDVVTEFGGNPAVAISAADIAARDLNGDGDNEDDGIGELGPAGSDRFNDVVSMSGTASLLTDAYGDDPNEPKFGKTVIVTEFFDTLSDSVSYDEVRILSNAPRFPYSVGTEEDRPLRVFVDSAATGPGGLPDLSTEEDGTGAAMAGTLIPGTVNPDGSKTGGFTFEVGQHFDRIDGTPQGTAQFDSRFLLTTVPAASELNQRRFVRVRICFELGNLDLVDGMRDDPPMVGAETLEEYLLRTFDPPGSAQEPIADDLGTAELDNTLGNTDTAPEGVLAVAEVRVRFTP